MKTSFSIFVITATLLFLNLQLQYNLLFYPSSSNVHAWYILKIHMYVCQHGTNNKYKTSCAWCVCLQNKYYEPLSICLLRTFKLNEAVLLSMVTKS